ncbi:Multidrug resistance protein MdtA [Castellaniella denitrificans]
MKALPFDRKRVLPAALILTLLGLFLYVALRSGPLARIPVTTARVQEAAIHPVRFGIGTVEARQIHRIGPTLTGRLLRLDVEVGDSVRAGQVLGEMDPVDLDDRIQAQAAALSRARVLAQESRIRQDRAEVQLRRYETLLKASAISEETTSDKRHELEAAQSALQAATRDIERLQAELAALRAQRRNLALVSPIDGFVLTRDADPGTTLMAGQAVVQVIAPGALGSTRASTRPAPPACRKVWRSGSCCGPAGWSRSRAGSPASNRSPTPLPRNCWPRSPRGRTSERRSAGPPRRRRRRSAECGRGRGKRAAGTDGTWRILMSRARSSACSWRLKREAIYRKFSEKNHSCP